jgi:RND superfamily putative drug exporter
VASFFYTFGSVIYRSRYLFIGLWLLAFLLCLPFLPKVMSPFKSSGFENIHSESQKTNIFLNQKLGYQDHRFLILFKKESECCDKKEFKQEVLKSLKGFKHVSYPHELLIIEKQDTILATLAFKDDISLSSHDIETLQQLIIKPKHAYVYYGGEDVFVENVNQQTQKDLYHADMIAAPIAALTLLFVFGSITAALMPLIIGGISAVMMLTSLFFIAHWMSLSIFTINIALLLGLCLSLDYALFIICRFREELLIHDDDCKAIAITMSTAGKAVFFSGLAVFCSLSALLLFPINILISVGIGGLCAVFLAVLGALTLLPAILSVIKNKINLGTIFPSPPSKSIFWRKLATHVIARPAICAFIGMGLLISCALPIKNLQLGISDYHILPTHSEGRVFFNAFKNSFDEPELSPISLVIQTKGPVESKKNIQLIYQLIKTLNQRKDVEKIDGYLTILPNANLETYEKFYLMPRNQLPAEVQQLLKTSTKKNIAVFYLISRYSSASSKTKDLVEDLRKIKMSGLNLMVTGVPANNVDVFSGIRSHILKAVLIILSITFLILMILLRSLFLPLKAIVMNILSLTATYGILVVIFQNGHLHEWLNFEPQGSLDISMLVIIFCALFGFSMDYEVFLLSRIQESYQKNHNNNESIVYGIEHSARIITSAALIVIVLCASFLVADVLIVKAFGLGIAVAIFIDAFIIRTFLVPAIMALTKRINWYFPAFLNKLLPNNH